MDKDIEWLIELSKEAGNAILSFYDDEIDVTKKEDDSPLTRADMASHHIIVDGLREHTPEIPVISEESGTPGFEIRKEWDKFWLIDPLDGTKEFIKKNDEFTVNIALLEDNIPVLGIVHIPAKGMTYVGQKNAGSFKLIGHGKMKPIHSSIPDTSSKLRIVASRSHGSSDLEERLEELGVITGETVPAGSSLKFCLVAEGVADIYPRFGPTMEWDTAAGDAVFRYSGRDQQRYSPIRYNKADMRNKGFVIGLK